MSLTSFWCVCCKLWIDFIYCSGVSFVDFEQVNATRDASIDKKNLQWSFFQSNFGMLEKC